MALENATTYAELQASDPKKTDPKNQGDDHLRMLKRVHKNIWKGIGGDGYAVPIEALEQDLNNLTGTNGNIQDQIDNIGSAGSSLALQLAELQLQVDAMIPLKVVGAFGGNTLVKLAGSPGWTVARDSGTPVGGYTITMDPPANGAYVVTVSSAALSAVDMVSASEFFIATIDANGTPYNPDEVHFMVVDA